MVRTLRLSSDPPEKDILLGQAVYPDTIYPLAPLPNHFDATESLDIMFNDHCQLRSPQTNPQFQPQSDNPPPSYGDSLPDILREPTSMTRQYSITTVMEVIENHKISDDNSEPKTKSELTFQRKPTQPIPILKPNTQAYTGSVTVMPANNNNISRNATMITVPSSDLRDGGNCSSPSLSNFSASPHLPFERYQTYPESMGSPHSLCSQTNSFYEPLTPMEQVRPDYETCMGVQETNNFSENGQNYQFNNTMQGDNFGFYASPNYNQNFDHQQNGCHQPGTEFVQSTSCPNFSNILPEYNTAMSPLLSNAITHNTQFFGLNDDLTEVDPNMLNEDIGMNLDELDRVDQRRIRNNQACKASRQRRKHRKIQIQQRAVSLETENKQLMEKIQRMESERDSLKAHVMRRMSQS